MLEKWGKRKDLSPRKKEQISVLLKHIDFKQKERGKRLNISTQTIRTKLEMGRNIHCCHNAQDRTTLDLGCVELQQLWFEPPLVRSVTGKI